MEITIATVIIKIVKIILNVIIYFIYRTGYDGEFLGVGGTWNLNEDKSPDVEIIASGVFGLFFMYTIVTLISLGLGMTKQEKTLVNIIINFLGCVLFLAISFIALHYWIGYQGEHKQKIVVHERRNGITLGVLCLLSAAVYLIDGFLSCLYFARDLND